MAVLGHPRPIDRAIEFNGVDDALYVQTHPLAGAETFTREVIFRPDRGGAAEQRFFPFRAMARTTACCLQSASPAIGGVSIPS